MRPAAWDDLSLVISWRQFMRDQQSFFRHLFGEQDARRRSMSSAGYDGGGP
jgi:hypothetical protein